MKRTALLSGAIAAVALLAPASATAALPGCTFEAGLSRCSVDVIVDEEGRTDCDKVLTIVTRTTVYRGMVNLRNVDHLPVVSFEESEPFFEEPDCLPGEA